MHGRSQAHWEWRLSRVRRQVEAAARHAENARALARAAAGAAGDDTDVGLTLGEPSDPPMSEGTASLRALSVVRALDRSRTPLVVLDDDATIEFANRAFLDWIRGAGGPHQAAGDDYAAMLTGLATPTPHRTYLDDAVNVIREVAAGTRSACAIELTHGPAGNACVHLVTAQHLPEGGAVVTHAEVTDVVRARQEYQRRAQHDSLTDLLNQRAFHDRGDRLTRDMVRKGRPVAVLMIDLDDFKEVNDAYGHATGDAVLMAVAKRLRHALRDGDLAGRVGGDEFATVMCDVADAHDLCARIWRTMSAPVASEGATVRVNPSVGLALAPWDGTSFEALLRMADQRMYLQKRNAGPTSEARPV